MTAKLCERRVCTGCGACRNKCPKDAISMEIDGEGFLSPVVDASKCVECGLCEKACPILNPPSTSDRDERPKTFACWNRDEKERAASASGGMFSVYAKQILRDGGVVFAVALDETQKAVFTKAESAAELAAQRSSKYAQADVGTVYRDVLTELRGGRTVLFVGVPCQVAGLNSFLGKRYDNLFVCDLVCHGAPSSTLFRKWLDYLEAKYGGKIRALNMRGKRDRRHHLVVASFDSRSKEAVFPWDASDADYLGWFRNNLSLRASCGECRFAKFPRQGNVTLGDFWGLGASTPFAYSNELARGVSMNLVNDAQGERLVAKSRDEAFWIERDFQEAWDGNPCLRTPSTLHPKRDEFCDDSTRCDYAELAAKYRRYYAPSTAKKMKRWLKRCIRRFLRRR